MVSAMGADNHSAATEVRGGEGPAQALASAAGRRGCHDLDQAWTTMLMRLLAPRTAGSRTRRGRRPRRTLPAASEPARCDTCRRREAGDDGDRERTAISPAEARPVWRRVTADSVVEIQQALLDAALGATREHWTTFT